MRLCIKTLSLISVLCLVLLFQNCGEEGFVSSRGVENFDSFEDAYPEMNDDGQIQKFEKSRNFYSVSPEVEREYTRTYRAVPNRPAPRNSGGNGGLGGGTVPTSGGIGGGTPVSGGGLPVSNPGSGGTPSAPTNDVDQQTPTFVGTDRDYYKDEFNFPAVVERAAQIKSFDHEIFPARYYGEPKYDQAFGGNGLGIIAVDQLLGASGRKTAAVFYQYKLDYLREKATVFVVEDGLSNGALGAQTVATAKADLIKLAKMGYLVVHLKLRHTSAAQLSNNRCAHLGRFFFNGAQEVRAAVGDLVSKANYFGADPNNMFAIGFGEGGTLMATTAFLDQSEAEARFGEPLVDVSGFASRGIFQGVAVSGGGLVDRSIVQGSSKASIVTIHGGADRKVSVLGEQIYDCQRDVNFKIDPAASEYLTNEVTAQQGHSASVLHCGKSSSSEVRPISTQIGYFATYFHNIISSRGSGSISSHYRQKHCTFEREGSQCSYPVPLISETIALTEGDPVGDYYTRGPCTPKPRQDNGR